MILSAHFLYWCRNKRMQLWSAFFTSNEAHQVPFCWLREGRVVIYLLNYESVHHIFFRINKHGYIHLTSDQELACHLGWQADIIHVAFDGGSREVHSDLFTDVIGRPGLCTTHCTTRLRIPVPHNVSQGPYGPTFQLIKRIHYILYTSQFLFVWANLFPQEM